MTEKPLTMETLIGELRTASREGPLALTRLRMLTTYDSRQAAVRNNPDHMAVLRQAFAESYAAIGVGEFWGPALAGDFDDDYNMDLVIEAFALGLIAGLNAKASIEETDQ